MKIDIFLHKAKQEFLKITPEIEEYWSGPQIQSTKVPNWIDSRYNLLIKNLKEFNTNKKIAFIIYDNLFELLIEDLETNTGILKYYDKIICYCDEAWWSAEDNNFFNERLKNLELYNSKFVFIFNFLYDGIKLEKFEYHYNIGGFKTILNSLLNIWGNDKFLLPSQNKENIKYNMIAKLGRPKYARLYFLKNIENYKCNNFVYAINSVHGNTETYINQLTDADTQTYTSIGYNENDLVPTKEFESEKLNINGPLVPNEDFESLSEIIFETRLHHLYFKLFTEKTLKGFLMKRPFLLGAHFGSLQCLRELGFKTFDFIFDESYDLIEDEKERTDFIIEEFKKFNDRSIEENYKIIKKHEYIYEYNFNHLIYLLNKKDKEFYNIIKKEL